MSAASSPYRTTSPVDRRIGYVDVVDPLAAALDRIAARRRALVEDDRPAVLQVHWEPRGLVWNDTGEAPASGESARPFTMVHGLVAVVVGCEALGLVAILALAFSLYPPATSGGDAGPLRCHAGLGNTVYIASPVLEDCPGCPVKFLRIALRTPI